MSTHAQTYKVSPDNERELARLLNSEEAKHEPVVVEIGGNRYRLVPEDDVLITDDPKASFDPQKAMEAVKAGAGAFKTINTDVFLADVLEAREQDTPGHTF